MGNASADLADMFAETESKDLRVAQARISPGHFETLKSDRRDEFDGDLLWNALIISDETIPPGHGFMKDEFGGVHYCCPHRKSTPPHMRSLCPEGACVARQVLEE